MTKPDFLDALSWELWLRGQAVPRPELEAFVAKVWPAAEADPDVRRWADAFAETGAKGTGLAGTAGTVRWAVRLFPWLRSTRMRMLCLEAAALVLVLVTILAAWNSVGKLLVNALK
jgi:hypothetical protein